MPLACAKKMALLLCLLLSGLNAQASAVHLRGSTTLLPIAQLVAETYMREHPDTRIVITAGGTERGYKAILDGTADIAMASSEPREDIVSECTLKNIQLQTHLLGYTSILTAVNAANPVNNLSLKQLKDIFTGRIANWKEVGGADMPIQVYVGPPNGGINDTWKKLILGENDTYTPKGIVKDNSERIHLSASAANAITFLTPDTGDTALKILSINQVAPKPQQVGDGSYPLRAPLMLVTTHHPSAAASAFIAFFSAQIKQAQLNNIAATKMLFEDKRHE